MIAAVTGLGALLALYGFLALPASASDRLLKEDGLVESIGALALFVTAGAFAVLARRAIPARRPLLAILVLAGSALVFFVGGGEEISWGQRIFDISTPESLSEINKQQETNLHNIGIVSTIAEATFFLLWVGMAVLAPLLSRVRFVGTLVRTYVPVIALPLGVVFVSNFIFAKVLQAALETQDSASRYPVVHRVTETKESVYALLFAIGAIYLLLRPTSRNSR